MPLTLADLLAEINVDLPTNTSGIIRANTMRQLLADIVSNPQGGGGGTTIISGGGLAGVYLTASATAQAGGIYYCDTSTGSLTVTLPTTPATTNMIGFRDALGTWGTANLILAPGGNNIDGTSGLLSCDVSDANFDLVWRGGSIGWATQFVVAPTIRRAAVVRTGAMIAAGVGDFLPGGQGVSHSGIFAMAGSAAFNPVKAAVVVTSTWNPSDKNSDITLSGSNLIATRTATGSGSTTHVNVRGTNSNTNAHKYFEMKATAMTVAGGQSGGVGIANSSHPLTNYLGSDSSNGIGIFPNGYIQGPSIAGNFTSGFAVNDIIGFELKPDPVPPTATLSVFVNSSLLWQFTALPSGALFPAGCLYSSSDSITLNTGTSAFAFSPPSGATAWNTI